MNKIIPFFFLDKIMPFNENLKLTHVAPKTRLLQLTNKKNWYLFSFHLGIDIITITNWGFKLMPFHLGIERKVIIITMSTQNDVVFYEQKKKMLL